MTAKRKGGGPHPATLEDAPGYGQGEVITGSGVLCPDSRSEILIGGEPFLITKRRSMQQQQPRMVARNSNVAWRIAQRTAGSASLLSMQQTAEHRSTATAGPQANTTAERGGQNFWPLLKKGHRSSYLETHSDPSQMAVLGCVLAKVRAYLAKYRTGHSVLYFPVYLGTWGSAERGGSVLH